MSTHMEEPDAPSTQTTNPLAGCAILSCTHAAAGADCSTGAVDTAVDDISSVPMQSNSTIVDDGGDGGSSHTIAPSATATDDDADAVRAHLDYRVSFGIRELGQSPSQAS